MKKRHFPNARLTGLALLVAPVMAWATDCWQADQFYNRSLQATPTQQVNLLNQAIESCPTHVNALNNLANIMENKGDLSKAQWLYDRAIKADPNFAPAYAGLGDVLMKRQDYQQAAKAFQNFLTKQETHRDPAYQGYVQHYIKRLKDAKSHIVVSGSEIFSSLTRTKSFGAPKVDVQIQFDTNSSKVTKQTWQQCREMAKAIKGVLKTPGLENSQVRIDGHTDNKGSAGYNKKLSKLRAESVKTVLVKDFGIPSDRLEVVGWGEEKPMDTNETELGRFNNRRVTLVRIDK